MFTSGREEEGQRGQRKPTAPPPVLLWGSHSLYSIIRPPNSHMLHTPSYKSRILLDEIYFILDWISLLQNAQDVLFQTLESHTLGKTLWGGDSNLHSAIRAPYLAQHIKPPVGMPTAHDGVQAWLLAPPLSVPLPANMRRDDDPRTHVEILNGAPESWLQLGPTLDFLKHWEYEIGNKRIHSLPLICALDR